MKYILKPVILSLVIISFLASAYGQQEILKPESADEKSISDLGPVITRDVYDLSSLKSYDKKSHDIKITTRIYELTSEQVTQYFLQISAESEYSDKSITIAEDDLNEIIKALKIIIEKSKEDSKMNLEHRERLFDTKDGFTIGYYQIETYQTFFMDLGNYSDNIYYFNDGFESLAEVLNKAKAKIESLKK